MHQGFFTCGVVASMIETQGGEVYGGDVVAVLELLPERRRRAQKKTELQFVQDVVSELRRRGETDLAWNAARKVFWRRKLSSKEKAAVAARKSIAAEKRAARRMK